MNRPRAHRLVPADAHFGTAPNPLLLNIDQAASDSGGDGFYPRSDAKFSASLFKVAVHGAR